MGSQETDSRSRIHERTCFVEVSGHNLESSHTLGFCMDFLNHREWGMVFYQVFLLSIYIHNIFPPFSFIQECTVTELYSRHSKWFCEFEELEISRQSCRGDCE